MPNKCREGQLAISGKCRDKDEISIQELAREFSGHFKKQTQNSGDVIVITDEESPEELDELVQEAHGNMFPDDLRYEFIRDAMNSISDSDNPEDDAGELVDSDVDIYTHDLTKWLGSRNDRFNYVDEAVKEFGHSDEGVIKEIMMGQYKEREEVFFSVLEGLKKILED
jgi:hypothetical protein